VDEAKTKLILEAEARGFDDVQKVVESVIGAVDGTGSKPSAMSQLDKVLANINTSLGKLDATVASIAKNASKISGAAGGGGTGGGSGGSGGGAGGGGGGQGGGTPSPSFLRGMLQGLGVAQYIPGMNRANMAQQAGGAMVGQGIMGFGQGLARGASTIGNGAFSGIGSIVQGAASIPGGGMLSGPAMAGIAAAESALELERAQREIGFATDFTSGRRAGARGGASALARGLERTASAEGLAEEEALARQYDTYAEGMRELNRVLPESVSGRQAGHRRDVATGQAGLLDTAQRAYHMTTVAPMASSASIDGINADARGAAGAARYRAQYGFDAAGAPYGMDRIETTRFAGEVARSRGGFTNALAAEGGLDAALAAQSFGVSGGMSGSILRGGRIGAGGGAGGDGLAKMIGQSMALGLEGSDVGENLQRMADGIARFESTGIPLAPGAMDSVARTLAGSGMHNTVAAGRSAAFVGAVQSRASEGLPGSATDFSALVHLGGYKGGGTEAALAARARLERGDFAAGGVDELTKMFAGQLNTGEYGRAYGVEQGFKRLGMSLGTDEAMALEARASGRELSPEQQARISAAEKRFRSGPQTVAELEEAAEGGVGGGLRRNAGISNTRVGSGQKTLQVVQDFEARAARAADGMAPLIDKLRILNPLLDGLVDGLTEVVRVVAGRIDVQAGQ
jgi:hypothetical protein